jgi:hypothetical protein
MSFKGHHHITHPDGSSEDAWDTFVCGHCNTKVTGAVVSLFTWKDNPGNTYNNKWLLCPSCTRPSAKFRNRYFPGTSFGPSLEGLPKDVDDAYEEARRCMEVNAYTAAELICRKILMHIGVEKGAKEGDPFAHYLSYLESAGYVTPPMKGWVDIIRQNGNKSTHKLEAAEEKRAKSTVMFTAELLRLTYEMEYLSNQYII